ncbi:major facilitator superfamily-like protein [Aureococcus anophagefferens]|nr:major facilitator superfamily-like protein [Aureococcus anophagefferens]
MNAFQFMNFSPIADLSTGVFSATTGQVSWLYSASLLSVLPAFFLAVRWTSAPATQRGALRAMHGLNLAAALLRAGSAYVGSYALAMASSVLLGVAASFVISAFTSVSQRWLPAAERPLGVSLTVQANYFGWLLGAVLVPYACVAKGGLVRLLEVQAAAAGLLFALAAFGAPEPPRTAAAAPRRGGRAADLDVAPPSPKFGLTTADIVFDEACAFSPKVTALANAAFIAAGVVTGLALGFAHDAYACVGLMAAAGASTIGFVGLALGEAGKSAGPNPAARVFSGGCVEWWLQVCGAAITQVASNRRGFETCAAFQGAALAAGAVALLGLRRD